MAYSYKVRKNRNRVHKSNEVLLEGDIVKILKKWDNHFRKDWLLVMKHDTKTWIPKEYVMNISDRVGLILKEFQFSEIATERGDLFEVYEIINNWAYGKLLHKNQTGYIPISYLDFFDMGGE